MKSFTGKFSSGRGWALLLILFLGAGFFVAACGDEEVPAPTTPAPTPPPPPTPAPEPPAPEKPATPTGLQVSAATADSITWSWTAVEGATGYAVQASRDEMFDDTDQLTLTAETSFTATSLPADTNVYVRVAAAVLTASAPSLDPKDYLLSDWTTHVTGTTAAAASQAPPAPTNVRVTKRSSNYIEWSWNAVAGAAGYHAQFSRTKDFSSPADDRPNISRTSVTISNLPAETDGYLRVRAYTGSGTGTDTVFGDWSTTVEGTTESAPAPVTTRLSAPTGLRDTARTTTTITLSWGEVEDAERYEVQQRASDGDWVGARCGGGDSMVSEEECEATGLTRGSNYGFRVRAHPDPDDDTLESSGWSSTASARTSGSPPAEPVTGGDDDLNITWESDDESITYFWDAATDNRIGYVTAVLADADPRPGCPALTAQNTWSDVIYANRRMLAAADVTPNLARGSVAGLCVRRTWMDDDGNQQYGPVSLAWGATNPMETTTPPAGLIAAGLKTEDRKTAAIDWYVDTKSGFEYELLTVSTDIDVGSLPACSSGAITDTLSGNGRPQRHRQNSPTPYTTYAACARAKNGDSNSGWTQLASHSAKAGAPTSVSVAQTTTGNLEYDATEVVVRVTASNTGNVPESSDNYQMVIVVRSETQGTTLVSTAPTQAVCDGATGNAVSTIEVTPTQFRGTATASLIANAGTPNTRSKANYIFACVRAKLPSDNDFAGDGVGPWKVSGRLTVTQNRQPSS